MNPFIKPNRFPAPGPIGNTQGIILPKTEADKRLSSPPPKPTKKEKGWWDKWGDVVHTTLDIVGMIPVVGEIADGANALIYAAEGDYANAALSAAAMLPVGGQAATAAKLANRAVKAGKKVAQKAAKKTAQKAAPKAAKAAAKKATKPPGGRVKGKKKPKKDKPPPCCPKNQGPGGKRRGGRKPIDYGTGEEILDQVDFEIEGPSPFAWIRTYRSGSECEDWGLLGARWATPYSASLSVCDEGIVFHEATGRALRLPNLKSGEQHNNRAESFVLRCDSDNLYTVTWSDGSRDDFTPGPDGWLPHGYDGVNAMLDTGPALRVKRYYLSRSSEPDGKAIHIERRHDARPGEWLLRIRCDEGPCLEALRDGLINPDPRDRTPEPPRIGQIDEIRPDGSRYCHVRYRYEAEPVAQPPVVPAKAAPGTTAFAKLPRRYNLVEQANSMGESRHYAYRCHLLVRCVNYAGFEQGVRWISLGFLRARWAGSTLGDNELIARHLITLDNSYQARAIGNTAADGLGEEYIEYLDEDTSRVREADGGVLEYTFNERWLITDVRRVPPNGGPPHSLGTREWDEDGMLLADIDASGRATRYRYDKAGNLTSIADALGRTTRIDYDQRNNPVTITDPLGNVSRQHYDDAGRIVATTDALGRSTQHGYDADGRLTTLTDARGGKKYLSYDSAGRLASYTDCSGHSTRYAYDASGRLAASADALGRRVEYRYDALGRMVEVLHPDRSKETYSYDAEGNLVAHTDAQGRLTRYRYNGHDLPVERIDANGQTLRYRYDRALRLIELINGNDESYRFTYDTESRLASETGFDGKTTTYTYDDAGQLVASECNGQRTEYLRDTVGQLLAKTTAEGFVRYAYDALGRLVAVAAPQAEQRFSYDPVGQLIEERIAYTPAAKPGRPAEPEAAFTLAHEYDVLGNRIKTILPNGRSIDTLRYGSGHWHGTQWQGRSVVDLERDALHRETRREIGAGQVRLTADSAYDPQSRLAAFTLQQGQKRLRERHYTYDPSGNLTRINDAQRGELRYSYDPIGQLLSAVQPNLTETFAFDPAGNLLDPKLQGDARAHGDVKPLIEQPGLGERGAPPPKLAKVTQNLLHEYLGTRYEYDRQGNTIVKRIAAIPGANEAALIEFAYDLENRLIQATRTWANSVQTASYAYDAFGRRIAKTVTETTAGTAKSATTWFVWDGEALLQEIQPEKTITYLYEPESFVPLARVESGEGQATYAPAQTYLPQVTDWDLPQNWECVEAHVQAWRAHVEAQREQAYRARWQRTQEKAKEAVTQDRLHYYHCDHLGTPLELLDDAGKPVWAARYRAWGQVLSYDVREVEQPLRFQGQYLDEETGLHYNFHRYYEPDSARYITQDPIGLAGGENLYQYVPNSTGWTDPWGNSRRQPQPGAPMHGSDRARPINGRMPQNSCFAGKTMTGPDLPPEIRGKYPHGVPFDMHGLPDFSRYARNSANVGSFTTDSRDFRAANNAAFGPGNRFGSSGRVTLNGTAYTWHHTGHNGKMLLVPADIHDAVKHTGGAAVCGTRQRRRRR